MKCQAITKKGVRCSRDAKLGSKFCWQHQKEEAVNNDELTDKQQRFCEEYVIEFNATQAAITAGYSEETADVQGSRLLKNVKVKKEIDKLLDAQAKRSKIKADRVLRELAIIGYSKITDYLEVIEKNVVIGYKKSGEPITEKKKVVEIKETDDMDPEAIKAISQIKQTKHGISLKLYDKPGALEDIGRHLGMWNDSLDITMNELPDINLVRGDNGDG